MRQKINRILCATDFSDVSRDVVPFGIRMARELNATLYICHVIDLPTISVYGEAVFDPITQQQRFIDFARQEIEALAGDTAVDWQPLITIGHTTEEIVRQAGEKAVDLVISATHGRSGLKRLFLGSVTERLMRILTCPLLVLRSPGESDRPIRQELPFKKILVGYDFSEDADAAFRVGLNMAQEFEAELHLMHVVEPTAYREYAKFPSAADEPLRRDMYDSIKSRMEKRVPADALNWCSLETQITVGKPYAELVDYAEHEAVDLIITGVRGHGMVEELLVGSTTDRVVRRAPCPVLSVCRPPSE